MENKISKKYIKTYEEFINESLAFLSLKKTSKNAFMNNLQLKSDFETAKRIFYVRGGCLLTHISGEKFELRSSSNISNEEIDYLIEELINPITEKMKFQRSVKSKRDIIKEFTWILKANIE